MKPIEFRRVEIHWQRRVVATVAESFAARFAIGSGKARPDIGERRRPPAEQAPKCPEPSLQLCKAVAGLIEKLRVANGDAAVGILIALLRRTSGRPHGIAKQIVKIVAF